MINNQEVIDMGLFKSESATEDDYKSLSTTQPKKQVFDHYDDVNTGMIGYATSGTYPGYAKPLPKTSKTRGITKTPNNVKNRRAKNKRAKQARQKMKHK